GPVGETGPRGRKGERGARGEAAPTTIGRSTVSIIVPSRRCRTENQERRSICARSLRPTTWKLVAREALRWRFRHGWHSWRLFAVTGLENSRLRKAVSDLTLDKLILQEAAWGNF